MPADTHRPFPLPVVSFQAAHGLDDETLDVLPLPSDMATFQPPPLPEREALAGHEAVLAALRDVCVALAEAAAGRDAAPVALDHLSPPDRALLNQVLSEGEVGAQVLPGAGAGTTAQIQESVFAGVWRVLLQHADGRTEDRVEVGAIPALLRQAARDDAAAGTGPLPPLPPELVNVPSLLVELAEQRQHWRAGQPAHVINLSLLPLSATDIGALDEQLGTGRVVILSRGYGNCRITDTLQVNTWRVVFYNSQDKVILNTVEVGGLPEVACASPEDLADSLERLGEVLAWMQPQ